jgi:hypothetical protein
MENTENSKESSIVSLLQEIEMLNKKLEETQKKLKISEGQTTMFRNKFKRIKRERDAYT